ncbi:hypothetical protein EB796_001858 [Bugula neritina]|uniref:Uncharacterized protein n=1 Tax=Bugula neritina TaxID=10212 RepID=A0A7J7KNU7_BUGNE|nr:hypothetical protein EB796_001858 [Bugula neritina]
MVSLLEKEKVDAAKMHSTAVANKQEEVDMLQAQLELHEEFSLLVAKNTEINTLVGQIEELSKQVDTASSVNDAELFRLQSQLKELQRQHSDILEQNHSTIKLKEEEMKRLYSEIGDMSAHLHAVNKDKDAEIQRLRNESSLLKEEKKDMLSDNQTLMQEKQTEIRKLMVDIEKMEVDAAKMRATNEQALSDVKAEYQLQMEQFSTDRAHLIAVKDNEIQNLRQEIDKLIGEAKDGGSSIAEMKKTIFQLEQDKAELLLLKEQWQADMDKIFSEYEVCKSDKDDFEGMVDRLSREMEDRVEGLKAQHIEELTTKDNLIRELYTKVEKIAKDRGEMSSHLHDVLQQKEQKIEELFKKLHEYDQCLDEAEQVFRSKLQKKAQEVKWLREEIRKMGEEGIRLLDMREREIGDMRDHLKTMLKVMEQRIKSRSSSHFVITRPQSMKPSEPHLKPSARSSKSLPKKTSRGSRTSSFFSSPSKKSSRQ